jgi:hypothetical protein
MDWCPTCCTSHKPDAVCPGVLAATGPERHGWRLAVDTPYGMESYGVLVAPSDKLWRARIVTFPSSLWSIPDGEAAIKFVGSSPDEAERQAADFIEAFCKRRGYKPHEVLPPVVTGPVDPEAADSAENGAPTPQRKLLAAPLRFGRTRPSRDAVTANVSERGLFVSTLDPMEPGATIALRLELEALSLPLRGVVTWSRRAAVRGRSRGMGIRLSHPPAVYVNYIRQL